MMATITMKMMNAATDPAMTADLLLESFCGFIGVSVGLYAFTDKRVLLMDLPMRTRDAFTISTRRDWSTESTSATAAPGGNWT
jgi:hypothetical protein